MSLQVKYVIFTLWVVACIWLLLFLVQNRINAAFQYHDCYSLQADKFFYPRLCPDKNIVWPMCWWFGGLYIDVFSSGMILLVYSSCISDWLNAACQNSLLCVSCLFRPLGCYSTPIVFHVMCLCGCCETSIVWVQLKLILCHVAQRDVWVLMSLFMFHCKFTFLDAFVYPVVCLAHTHPVYIHVEQGIHENLCSDCDRELNVSKDVPYSGY